MFGPRSALSNWMHSRAASTTGMLSNDYTYAHQTPSLRVSRPSHTYTLHLGPSNPTCHHTTITKSITAITHIHSASWTIKPHMPSHHHNKKYHGHHTHTHYILHHQTPHAITPWLLNQEVITLLHKIWNIWNIQYVQNLLVNIFRKDTCTYSMVNMCNICNILSVFYLVVMK